MPALRVYLDALRNRQIRVARKLGRDKRQDNQETRVNDLSLLAMTAVLAKALVDNGVLTDAQLLAAFDGAGDDTYPVEAAEIPPAGDDP